MEILFEQEGLKDEASDRVLDRAGGDKWIERRYVAAHSESETTLLGPKNERSHQKGKDEIESSCFPVHDSPRAE